jgi:hypothetical protein
MIELRRQTNMDHWWHVSSNFVPTQNLTAKEVKQIAERDALLDRLATLKGEVWIKINNGIFRGSIFPAMVEGPRSNFGDYGPSFAATVEPKNDVRLTKGGGTPLSFFVKDFDKNKGWAWSKRAAWIYTLSGTKPIVFKEATIYPEFFGNEVDNNLSVLLDYQGDRVFQINEAKRPLTFTDRLDQEVTIGDLVVVALNYGAGLDICMVKGFADERRVVIESVDTGERDRIPLENNATKKIMRMPNSLRDTAMLMKLSR